MTKRYSRMPGMNRRTFLQVSAAGAITATPLGGIGRANAAPHPGLRFVLAAPACRLHRSIR